MLLYKAIQMFSLSLRVNCGYTWIKSFTFRMKMNEVMLCLLNTLSYVMNKLVDMQ